jgi:hypothetical protein
MTVRYELLHHPEATSRTLNAWKCTGYDAAGRVTVIQCGDTAQGALGNALRYSP